MTPQLDPRSEATEAVEGAKIAQNSTSIGYLGGVRVGGVLQHCGSHDNANLTYSIDLNYILATCTNERRATEK